MVTRLTHQRVGRCANRLILIFDSGLQREIRFHILPSSSPVDVHLYGIGASLKRCACVLIAVLSVVDGDGSRQDVEIATARTRCHFNGEELTAIKLCLVLEAFIPGDGVFYRGGLANSQYKRHLLRILCE